MADEKQAQRDEAKATEKEKRFEDLEVPHETAEEVKGGGSASGGWDIKQNKSV